MTLIRTSIAIILLALPLAGTPVAADDASDFPNQIVVFGGVSILDASRTSTTTWPPGIPAFPGWPDRFPGPGIDGFPEIQLRTSASLGNSVVLGARYSRYIKDRLSVEADISVGPGHDLEPGGEICFEGRCLGGGDIDRFPVRLPGGDLGRWRGQSVTAWQYGGGLAYDITGGDVRPVIVFGAGGVSWSGTGRTETDFELRFGAGLKILFGRVGARIDVIDHLVLDHFLTGSSEHNLHVTAGLLVGF
jgi:hypothetical protein